MGDINILLILLIAFILIYGIKLALKLNKALDIYITINKGDTHVKKRDI